jgi:hypothetical protein
MVIMVMEYDCFTEQGRYEFSQIVRNDKEKEEYEKNMKLYESYGIITDPEEILRFAKADKSNKNDAEYMAKRITKEQYIKNQIKISKLKIPTE